MKRSTPDMAGQTANAVASRARAGMFACPAPWYGTGTASIDVTVFGHKLDPQRLEETSQ